MKYQKEKGGEHCAALLCVQVTADVSRCNSHLSPSEGAVGFDFRYPKGIAGLACQDKKEKKKSRDGNREGREGETVRQRGRGSKKETD